MATKATYACLNAQAVDCDTSFELPIHKLAGCGATYGATESEISDIWITKFSEKYNIPQGGGIPINQETTPGTPDFDPDNEDWKDSANLIGMEAAAPAATADPVILPDDKVLHLLTIGDKPLPEFNQLTLARGLTKNVATTHTLNIDITDMAIANFDDGANPPVLQNPAGNGPWSAQSIPNYDIIRALQAQPKLVIWYRTIGGVIVGGPRGIVCEVNQAGNIFGRGEGTLLTGQFVLTWDADCDPPAAYDSNDNFPNA